MNQSENPKMINAAIDGDMEELKHLIEVLKIHPNAPTEHYYHGKAIHLAVKHGHLDCVKYLYEKILELDGPYDPSELTPTSRSRRPHPLAVSNSTGLTCLHLAAWRHHPHVAEYLLEVGHPVDVKCRDGYTPYTWAVSGDSYDIATMIAKEAPYVVHLDLERNACPGHQSYDAKINIYDDSLWICEEQILQGNL